MDTSPSLRLIAGVAMGLVACGGAANGKSSGSSEGGAAGTAPSGGLAGTQGGSATAGGGASSVQGGEASAFGGASAGGASAGGGPSAGGGAIGTGGCLPTPSAPAQDPRCPMGVLYGGLSGNQCAPEGLTCQALVVTGTNLCMQPPILWPFTCCNGTWSDPSCVGSGGSGGAGGGPVLNGCYDVGWGLSADGTLLPERGDEDVPIFTVKEPAPPIYDGPVCKQLDQWRCHLGNMIIGAQEAAATLAGAGGDITPGAYALVSLTAFGGMDPLALIGMHFTQTLSFSPTSVVFQSDDDRRFSYTGSYRYAVDGSALSLTPTCESQTEQYRPWSLDMTFTASANKLELFSSTLSFHATYELIR